MSCTQRAGARRCAFSPASYRCCTRCSFGAAGTLQSARRPDSQQMKRTRPCPLNHCVRGVNDLPRRAAMDQGRLRRFRSQLASRAGGSRETSRQSIDRDARSTTPKRQMDNIMYLYEQLGPPEAPTRPRRRRIGGGGLNWVAWPGVGATEDGACRGGAARDPGRRGRPRRPTRYSLRQMRRTAARDFAGRS